MDKNQLLFLLGGLALGYLAFKTFSAKEKEEGTQVNPKLADCQEQLKEHLKMVKMSADQIDSYSQQFISECLTGTCMFSPEANI